MSSSPANLSSDSSVALTAVDVPEAHNPVMAFPKWGHIMVGRETFRRISSAFFYASASFFIVFINKIVLTTFKFPSYEVLGLGQMVVTILTLYMAKQLSVIKFPDFSTEVVVKVWPLPLFYLGNVACGLGGTQKLKFLLPGEYTYVQKPISASLPMFTVLRRFSILFTMILEYFVLGVLASGKVQLSVILMILGALVAASDDLAFDALGYFLITINNLCTAGNGVFTKKKLNAQFLGKYGLLFYNSLFMLVPLAGVAVIKDGLTETLDFKGWADPVFVAYFIASSCMGLVLNYATVMCTAYNSALTTTVVGVFKNLLITYLGMFIGNDYIFTWVNFIGLNISVLGSLLYSYVTFKSPASKTLASDGKMESGSVYQTVIKM